MSNTMSSRPSHQRGLGLVEALIAFLVLSLGMLAVVRLQPVLRQHAEAARQRSEATRLAQLDLEQARGANPVPAATNDVDEPGTSTSYRVQREVDTVSWPQAAAVTVTVSWTERDGATQRLRLASVVATRDPALAAVAMLPR